MANKDSKSINEPKVEAISLDDWVVTPVSIDEWVVEGEETPAAPPVDATAETLVVPPEPVKAETVDIDDWVLEEDDDKPDAIGVDFSDEELSGPIEVDDNTFAESGLIEKPNFDQENQTQTMDVGLQGDLEELEEDTSLEEISIEQKSEKDESVEDEDDLLSDFDNDMGMQVKEDPFEPDEPVPSIGDLEFPPTTMENVELDFSSDTVVEENEISKDEVLEASLDADDPIPSVGDPNDLAFPPTGVEKVELDFSSETAILEIEEAKKVEESEDQDDLKLDDDIAEQPESEDQKDELDVVESSVDLDLDERPKEEEVDLSLDQTDDELEVVESSVDLDLDDDEPIDSDISIESEQTETPAAAELSSEAVIAPEQIDAPLQLTENDLAPPLTTKSPNALTENRTLHLQDFDLAENHWVRLSEMDLAANHQLGVLRLSEYDLRENSVLPVIRLREHDYADHHRKVIELDPNFFEENDIERDVKGVILLKPEDLVDPSILEEEEEPASMTSSIKERKLKKLKENKESFFTDAMIVKICAIVIAFCLVAIPLRFHFKYSWTTISQKEYDEIKEQTSSIDWLFKTMFLYRTSDSSFRWYGVRKLNPKAYKKAERDGAMMWLMYEQGRKGDDYP